MLSGTSEIGLFTSSLLRNRVKNVTPQTSTNVSARFLRYLRGLKKNFRAFLLRCGLYSGRVKFIRISRSFTILLPSEREISRMTRNRWEVWLLNYESTANFTSLRL